MLCRADCHIPVVSCALCISQMCDISHLSPRSPVNSPDHHSVPFVYFYSNYRGVIPFQRNGTGICHKGGICSVRGASGRLQSDAERGGQGHVHRRVLVDMPRRSRFLGAAYVACSGCSSAEGGSAPLVKARGIVGRRRPSNSASAACQEKTPEHAKPGSRRAFTTTHRRTARTWGRKT